MYTFPMIHLEIYRIKKKIGSFFKVRPMKSCISFVILHRTKNKTVCKAEIKTRDRLYFSGSQYTVYLV